MPLPVPKNKESQFVTRYGKKLKNRGKKLKNNIIKFIY